MPGLTMRAHLPIPVDRRLTQRLLRCLLWLALLLPVAQVAASWHELSHLAQDGAAGGQERSALHLGHCELCLNAAAVHAAGPLAPPLVWRGPVQVHALPSAPPVVQPATALALAYRSRAPPASPV
jgi:hypothetical protein